MSIDRSLKVRGILARHRNVLTRAERIEKLKDDEKWSDEDTVLGLPKVAHRKSHAGRKEKAAPKEAVATEAIAGAATEAAPATTDKTAAKTAAKTPAAKATAKAPAKTPAAEPKPKGKA